MRAAIINSRPSSYLSCASLARELDVSESTVRDWVEKGLLPRPIKRGGSVRWSWADVQATMSSVAPVPPRITDDPYMAGAVNAAKAS
ncbi:helix-turn-helix domain-containing protein [Neorhizobium galegae]|uniref:helix-turn-helix transcriptional regulator n=1 Tax=Neorhizobium galegae TaxID=399 RepID=UPI00155DE601